MEGFLGSSYKFRLAILISIILLASAFSLYGCSRESQVRFHAESKHSLNGTKNMPARHFLGNEIVPIQTGHEEFYKAVGWLGDEAILYIANEGNSSSLYEYALGSGESKKLFKSDFPIIAAEISPGGNSVLLHSSDSNAAILTLIDLAGKELFAAKIESYELSFVWNPFKEDQIVISAFTEDWDFNAYLLDISKNKMDKIELAEPFVGWISSDELVFQEWEKEGMSLRAPLSSYSLKDHTKREVLPELYQFDTLGKYLLTVNITEEDPAHALYSIYKGAVEMIASFQVPVLTSFSGWLVPFYDLMEDGKNLLYLRPVHEGEADLYEDGFDLIKLSLASKKEELILPGLANEPISCSPSGEMCLFGFQFEKLLNVDTKEMIILAN